MVYPLDVILTGQAARAARELLDRAKAMLDERRERNTGRWPGRGWDPPQPAPGAVQRRRLLALVDRGRIRASYEDAKAQGIGDARGLRVGVITADVERVGATG